MKRLMKLAGVGTAVSCIAVVLLLIFFELRHGGEIAFAGWKYSRINFGAIIAGLGFSVPFILYDIEKIPQSVKIAIHVIICIAAVFGGCMIAGIFSAETDPKIYIILFFGTLVVFVLIWFFYINHYQNMADTINKKLKEKDPDYNELLRQSRLEEEENTYGKYKKWSPEAAKSDDFLFQGQWMLNRVLRNRKEPEWNKLGIRIGVILIIIFVLFFIVMGSLPDSFFEVTDNNSIRDLYYWMRDPHV